MTDEHLSLQRRTEGPARGLPFERVVLVLQGGGALGAYQAGVFEALAEARINVDWLCGTSIGAINGALIAGNPPDRRLDRLREFWDIVTEPAIRFPPFPWLSDLPWTGDVRTRRWADRMSALTTMMHGASGFFTPRPLPPVNSSSDTPETVSYYDMTPLRQTLERLVDFDLINAQTMRYSVGAANIGNGQSVYFNNFDRKIDLRHVLASASLPPSFPPTEIDGDYYWDGGVVSNSPIQYIVDSRQEYSALVFQVDLWDANGEMPLDIPSANMRAIEMHGASRLTRSLQQHRHIQTLRRAAHHVLGLLPDSARDDPMVQLLAAEAKAKVATVVQLKYQSKTYETAWKTFEFSRHTMRERWQAGYDDTQSALAAPGVLELPNEKEMARVYNVHHGWVTE
jgi:NTE family protein